MIDRLLGSPSSVVILLGLLCAVLAVLSWWDDRA